MWQVSLDDERVVGEFDLSLVSAAMRLAYHFRKKLWGLPLSLLAASGLHTTIMYGECCFGSQQYSRYTAFWQKSISKGRQIYIA